MYFFTEPSIDLQASISVAQSVLNSTIEYEQFLTEKIQRSVFDTYAAFQPFNESTRAFYSLVDEIKKQIKPGTPILDLWGRTGWSGESLAALFPDSPVFTIWERNKGTLGYFGYQYWLNETCRRPNLTVVFSDLEKPLPFSSKTIGLIHGLDTFHRYGQSPLIGECLRVASDSASIVFPHIHLTNSEPEPYFDRGCTQHHGKVYRAYLDKIEKAHQRKCYLLSEVSLFESNSHIKMADESDMSHYNALLYIAPKQVEESQINPCHWPKMEYGLDSKVLLNPFLFYNLEESKIEKNVSASIAGGSIDKFMDRHPVYKKRLNRLLPLSINSLQKRLIYCVERGLGLKEICKLVDLNINDLINEFLKLQDQEICALSNISQGMVNLQKFYSDQKPNFKCADFYEKPSFSTLWNKWNEAEEDWSVFISSTEQISYSWFDAKHLIPNIASRYREMGLKKGDSVAICSYQHPEYILSIWACWYLGLIVVPLDHSLSDDRLRLVLDKIEPKLLFLAPDKNPLISLNDKFNYKQINFDPLSGSSLFSYLFSDWLQEAEEKPIDPVYVETDECAVILFTSGTTGEPKGIKHSFSNLARGAEKLTRYYDLSDKKSLVSFGDLHSMSGLRNIAVLAFVNRQTAILFDDNQQSPSSRLTLLNRQYLPEIIFCTPALIEIVDKLKDRVDFRSWARKSTWLVTGSSANPELLTRVSLALETRVENYYGLTETGGVCCGTKSVLSENGERLFNEGIGSGIGSLIDIQDAEGKTCDENIVGDLIVFSDQMMLGYINQDSNRLHSQFNTGDLAYRTDNGDIVLVGRKDDQIKTLSGEILHLNTISKKLQIRFPDVEFNLESNSGSLLLIVKKQFEEDLYQNSEVIQLIEGIRIIAEEPIGHIEVINKID